MTIADLPEWAIKSSHISHKRGCAANFNKWRTTIFFFLQEDQLSFYFSASYRSIASQNGKRENPR
jgi:hypothetical protein